ncbi:unnamed protein product [Gongylonema pulchrum]|uniref:MATH domain-containing protein n=1 Tax=Gongylonema pulchrum TaxID=637853 RepID=A0A183EWQ3_9BILA|nr:unnamed protein product [Gongylonema pulchrum]
MKWKYTVPVRKIRIQEFHFISICECKIDDFWSTKLCPFSTVVFRKRHRVGLRLNVYSVEGEDRKLALIVKYCNSSSSFEPAASGDYTWLQHRLYISLGSAIAAASATEDA